MYKEDLINDLTSTIKISHPDISTATVNNIVSTVIDSNLTEEYFSDNKLNNLPESLITKLNNLPANLVTNLSNSVLKAINEGVSYTIREIVQNNQVVNQGIDVSVNNNYAITFDEYNACLDNTDEPKNQVTTSPVLLPENIKTFVSKMQKGMETDFSLKGSRIRGIKYITNGIYIACCKYWDISYDKVIEGFKKRKIKGFETKGLLPLLAYYYMSGIKTGTYEPEHSDGDNTSYRLIPDNMITKYENIMINNINSFLISNLPDSYKVNMDNLEKFMNYFNRAFIGTDEMSSIISMYRY